MDAVESNRRIIPKPAATLQELLGELHGLLAAPRFRDEPELKRAIYLIHKSLKAIVELADLPEEF